MAYISQKIPNLINGVSQQPDDLRLFSQGQDQVNGISSVVEGLKKRPPTEYIAKISSNTNFNNAFIHTINRDVTERYVVTITNGGISVNDVDGTQRTVVAPNGLSYLNSSNPRQDFAATTIADFTFIVNKNKTVLKSNTVSATRPFEAIYSVKQGNANTEYNIVINGTTYTYTTTGTASSHQATEIVDQLVSAIGSLSGFTITDLGTDIYIANSSSDFTISASDGFGSQASQVIKGETNAFSNLPQRAVNGMVVEIAGSPDNTFDNYYVVYESANNTDVGVWKETVEPGLKNNFDLDTMPHVLIRTADNNFRFTEVDGSNYTISGTQYSVPNYEGRIVGDEISASDPSFINSKINDVFLFRNRLGFIAGENIIMSRSGDFFKFYPETVTQILDTDQIDINVSHTKVSTLRHAIPFNEELLIFSDQTQFNVGTSASTLTPKTVNAVVSTEFENNRLTKPVSIGKSVFFMFDKGTFSGMREYFINQNEVKDSDDVSGNIPKYLPANFYKLAAATNESIICGLSSSEVNSMYIYQFYYANNQKLQSAWHKFTFGTASNTKILNVDFIDTDLFMIVQRSDGLYIMKMDLSPAAVDAGASYMTHLDSKLSESSTGVSQSYNSTNNRTTITIPYTVDNTMQVVTRFVSGNATIAGQVQNIHSQSGTSIVVNGDLTGKKYFIGEQFTFEYEFSKQFLRRENNVAITEGRTQIRNFAVNFNDTGFFTVEVTPENRDTSTYTFTGNVVGNAEIGSVNLNDGTFRFAVASQNEKLKMVIKNDTFLPSLFTSAEWEGIFYKRAAG